MNSIRTESKATIIRPLIAARGWTRRSVALKAGISPQVLNNVICGNNQGQKSRLAIERALGISLWTDPFSTSKPIPPARKLAKLHTDNQ